MTTIEPEIATPTDPDRLPTLRGRGRFLSRRPSARSRMADRLSARGPLLLRTAAWGVFRTAPPLVIVPEHTGRTASAPPTAATPNDAIRNAATPNAATPTARFFHSLAAQTPASVRPIVPAHPVGAPEQREVMAGRALAARLERDDPPQTPTASVRQFLADRLGLRPPRVLVHVGPSADRLARLHGADAVSFADRVAFRHRRYEPHTPAGLALLGHELTHVAHAAGMPAPPAGDVERVALANEAKIGRVLARSPVTIAAEPTATSSPTLASSPVRAAREDRPMAPAPPTAAEPLSERELARIKDAVVRDLRDRLRTEFERGS